VSHFPFGSTRNYPTVRRELQDPGSREIEALNDMSDGVPLQRWILELKEPRQSRTHLAGC
jgi:hypothetical protein